MPVPVPQRKEPGNSQAEFNPSWVQFPAISGEARSYGLVYNVPEDNWQILPINKKQCRGRIFS